MMDDRTLTGEQGDTTVGSHYADGTRQDATVAPTVTVIEAARILGVSVDAVRSRLRRGTLEGEKVEGEWHVRLTDRQDADRTATVVDLAPLAELIERQGKELADLREAAAVWQIRARQAEERLLELGTGETTSRTSSEATGSPQNDDPPVQGLRALGTLRLWWRRLWGE